MVAVVQDNVQMFSSLFIVQFHHSHTLKGDSTINNISRKVVTNTNIIKARLKYDWENFLTLHFSKGECWKIIIKHPKNSADLAMPDY